MNELSDLEIGRLCAEAMGLTLLPAYPHGDIRYRADASYDGLMYDRDGNHFFTDRGAYDPLHDDAQCFALIVRFELYTEPPDDDGDWTAFSMKEKGSAIGKTLNAAVCLCVARMQQERKQ